MGTMLARLGLVESIRYGNCRPLVSSTEVESLKNRSSQHADLGIAGEDLLNDALTDDTLGDGYVSNIPPMPAHGILTWGRSSASRFISNGETSTRCLSVNVQ
jgi:hypothetical protein